MGYGIYTSLIIVIFDILLNAGQLICNTLRSEYFFFNKVIPVILLCLYTRATSHEFHNSKWTHLPWKKKINANNNSNILYSYLYCVDGSKWGFYWIGRGWNKFIWCSTCGLQAYWFGGGGYIILRIINAWVFFLLLSRYVNLIRLDLKENVGSFYELRYNDDMFTSFNQNVHAQYKVMVT